MLDHIARFIVEDTGDDLVEYVLLAALIGSAGTVALNALPAVMNAVYATWDAGAQALWEPNDPTP